MTTLVVALTLSLGILVRDRNVARRRAAQQQRRQCAQISLRRALQIGTTSKAIARAVLHVLVDCCRARAGLFYLMRGGQVLELAAQSGETWPFVATPQVKLGEGLAGKVAVRRRLTCEPAPGINDGASFVAVPFQMTGRVKGVALLWLAAPADDDALDLLNESIEPVAVAIDSRRARERVQLLLEETRRHVAAHARQQRELQQTNLRLQRSDRYKNEFLANMTHELRSPLNSMLLLSQVLAENRRGNLAPDEVDAAQVINKAGRELLVIIDDILDLTKAEAGRLELHPEDMRLADLAESLTALYRPLAKRRKLDLEVRVEPGTPEVCRTDPTRLSQILKNLLNNALKFTERGSVSLSIAPAPGLPGTLPAIEFAVADTGIGISPDVLPALFAAFTQGDGSISRRFGGSGLGLSICRKLAELLQGRITVASEPGRGSTFTLRVPVVLPAQASPSGGPAVPVDGVGALRPATVTATIAPPALGIGVNAGAGSAAVSPSTVVAASREAGGLLTGRAVLMVDGDMRAAFRLSAVLEAAGARVRVVRDPVAALTLSVDGGRPDLLLVRPPVLSVLTAAGQHDWWRAAATATRVVIMSSMIPVSTVVPPGLPVLAPDSPAVRICQTLADLLTRAPSGGVMTAEGVSC